MICKRSSNDPLLREMLDRYGINLIVPPRPRSDLLPGDLLIGTGGNKVRKGGWAEILGHEPSADVTKGAGVESLVFKSSNVLDAEASASAVGTFLHSLGITTPRMKAALQAAASRQLKLTVEAPASLSLANVDAVLAELRAAKAAPNPSYSRAKLFLVTRIYRARGLRLEAVRESANETKVSTNAAELLSVDAKVKVEARRDGGLNFRADKAVVFGVAVRRLDFGASGLIDRDPEELLKIMGGDQAPVVTGDAIDEAEIVCVFEDTGPNNSLAS